MNIYKQRLLNCARACREANGKGFTMRTTSHVDGTPACALGQYAHRTDLQKSFKLALRVGIVFLKSTIEDHFGITPAESSLLFCAHGCDDAKTPMEAAMYIERFAAHKWPEETTLDPAFARLRSTLETHKIAEEETV